MFVDIFHEIVQTVDAFQENGENLIESFLRLPSLVEFPDYYKLVESPIDVSMIEEKIEKQQVNRHDR